MTAALDDSRRVAVMDRLSDLGVAYLEPEHVVYESLVDGARAEVEWTNEGYTGMGAAFAFFGNELIVSGNQLVRLDLDTLQTSVLLDRGTVNPFNLGPLISASSSADLSPCLYDGTSTRCWEESPEVESQSLVDGGVLVQTAETSWLFTMQGARELRGRHIASGILSNDTLCGLDDDVGLVTSTSMDAPVREVSIPGADEPRLVPTPGRSDRHDGARRGRTPMRHGAARWRRLNGPHLLPLVRSGTRFVDGELAEREGDQAKDAV